MLLIKNRTLNPDAVLTLVYSSTILSNIGIEQLTTFCKHNKIEVIDIDDKELRKHFFTPTDGQLLSLAQLELQKWITNKGGDVASASDITRWIIPIIEKGGNYLDLDIVHNFGDAPPVVSGNASLLLPWSCGFKCYFCYPSVEAIIRPVLNVLNNDIIFHARDNKGYNLSSESLHNILLIQDELIKKSQDLQYAIFRYEWDEIIELQHHAKLVAKLLYDHCVSRNPNSTIHDVRMLSHELDQRRLLLMFHEKNNADLKALCEGLDINSISLNECKILFAKFIGRTPTIEISDNQLSLIKHRLESDLTVFSTGSRVIIRALTDKLNLVDSNDYTKFIANCNNCDFEKNNLSKFILSSGASYKKDENDNELVNNRGIADILTNPLTATWTQAGGAKSNVYNADLEQKITFIQSYVRGYNARTTSSNLI